MYLNKVSILLSFLLLEFCVFAMQPDIKLKAKYAEIAYATPEIKYARTKRDWEFLYYVSKNRMDRVQGLIDQDFNVNIKDHDDIKALETAIYNNSPDMVKLLVRNGACIEKGDLRKAITWGKDKAAKALIKLGVDVNFKKLEFSESILIRVVWEMSASEQLKHIIPILIRKGADRSCTFFGNTAYDYANKRKNKDGGWDAKLLELLKPKIKI